MKKNNKVSLLKKIIKKLPVLLAVVAVVCTVFLLKDYDVPTVVPVADVRVDGELNYIDKKQVELFVKNNISGGYFTVDLNSVREILLHQPWIKNVSLRRQWPAGIYIFIEEKRPIAYWNDDGYLSASGEIFKPATLDRTLNLPNLNGPQGQHNNVWKFMNTLYQKMAVLDFEVKRLNMDERRAWQLVISNDAGLADSEANEIKIKLGRFDTEKRMQRFVRILPALTNENGFAENKIKVIDMRYPNGFAVQTTAAQLREV